MENKDSRLAATSPSQDFRRLQSLRRRLREALSPLFTRRERDKPFDVAAFCMDRGDGIDLVLTPHAAKGGNDVAADPRPPRGSPVLLLLPKAFYLQRIIELPSARDADIRSMLALTLESVMPADYGDFEMGYRALRATTTGTCLYEVYAVRKAVIDDQLRRFSERGIQATYMVPSSMIWALLFASEGAPHLAVVAERPDHFEASAQAQDSSLTIRSIDTRGSDSSVMLAHARLLECIRQLLSGPEMQAQPLRVGWIGAAYALPPLDRLCAEDLGSRFPSLSTREHDVHPLLRIAVALVPAMESTSLLDKANLLPQNVAHARNSKLFLRNLCVFSGYLLLSALLLVVGLGIAEWRYGLRSKELDTRIAGIKDQGQAVSQRLEQLDAITKIRKTSSDLHDILQTLHRLTPQGISYNQIELTLDKKVLVRGQAGSISEPFRLPGILEGDERLRNVILEDAGQVSTSQGAQTEFRIACDLVPKS